MKKLIAGACIILLVPAAVAYSQSYNRQLNENRDMVKRQRAEDVERKEALLRKMREFMGEINGRLGADTGVKIGAPLDMGEATDIKKTDQFHTSKKVPERVFAYAVDDVPLRSDGNAGSQAVSKVGFTERVEVILQSEGMDTVGGKTRPWFLVRKENGSEGWIFGGFLQRKKPERRPEAVPPVVKEKETAVPVAPAAGQAEKFFVHVTADGVRMRSVGNSGGEVTGNFAFGERVEVLEQSKEMESIDGKKRPWFRVRRETGEEGWVFGGFLQKKKPDRGEEPAIAAAPGDREFMVPTAGKVSSRFGHRVHPVTKKSASFHSGIDIFAPRGTKVSAAAGGTIKTASFNRNGYGNLIIIEHEKDVTSYYAHLEKILASPGQRVNKGDLIGTVDSTGMSTGNHLHFEIRKGGTALDPDAFLR